MSNTNFKIHVHRANLHDANKKAKWYAHIQEWGPEPREFVDIILNVPCRTVLGGLPGIDNPSCGCAQAWLEGDVKTTEIDMSDDYAVLTLGKARKKNG